MENAQTQRALEETARTLARLASSPKNIESLVESGTLTTMCGLLEKNADSLSSDMIASMITALTRICDLMGEECVDQIVASGALGPMR